MLVLPDGATAYVPWTIERGVPLPHKGAYGHTVSEGWSLRGAMMHPATPISRGYFAVVRSQRSGAGSRHAVVSAPVRPAEVPQPRMQIVWLPFAGRTETEVAADLAALLRKHGHSQVDVTVVGSGANGANPHHEMGERTIQQGDMVVLDFGGLKDGYGSDTTRTVHVGEPAEEELKVFEIVRRAQQAGFEAVRPGVACQEIDRAARR
jgi:hypothetical protein